MLLNRISDIARLLGAVGLGGGLGEGQEALRLREFGGVHVFELHPIHELHLSRTLVLRFRPGQGWPIHGPHARHVGKLVPVLGRLRAGLGRDARLPVGRDAQVLMSAGRPGGLRIFVRCQNSSRDVVGADRLAWPIRLAGVRLLGRSLASSVCRARAVVEVPAGGVDGRALLVFHL